MLHFLGTLIITLITLTLLLFSLGSYLSIEDANCTLKMHQLKMLNMMIIAIRNEAEVCENRVQRVPDIRGVHRFSLGITVVILIQTIIFQLYLILIRTWKFSVCSLHSVLKKYLIPMNIVVYYLLINRGTIGVQVL